MKIKKSLTKNSKVLSIILLIIIFVKNTSNSSENFEIMAKKVEFIKSENLVIANGDAKAIHASGKKILANKILYYKNKNLIKTIENSLFSDGDINISAKQFFYDTKLKIIKASGNVVLTDKNKNKFFFEEFEYDQIKLIGKGKRVRVKTTEGIYLKSKDAIIKKSNDTIELNFADFTTCSKIKNDNNEFCPSWSINSKKTTHNKKERKISHKHAVLKLKNIPVFYTPYITHPDPSVKRQSGFLPPIVKTLTNIGRTIQVPYFWSLDVDKDITITPTYYFNEHDLLKTSYRQAFKNGFLNIETGYSKGYKRLNKTGRTKGSRNYFFTEYNKKLPNFVFDNSDIKIKIQKISQQNFVRVNKINTKLFKNDIRILENTLQISSNKKNKRFNLKIGAFENMDVFDNAKYTYYLPDGAYQQNKNYKKFNLNFNSFFQGKKFEKNQKQGKVRNSVLIDTKKLILKKNGIDTMLKFALHNNNIYNDNVAGLKNNLNIDNYFTLASDSSLPLAKFSKKKYQLIKPRVFIKYTSGKMQDASSNEKIMNYSDIFSMNRTNNLDTPEVGTSAGYGIDYLFSENNLSKSGISKKLSSGFGQVYRTKAQSLMPNKSSLNNKSSDFVGYLKYDLYGQNNNYKNNKDDKIKFLSNFEKNFLTFNYKFNLENDLSEFSKNSIELSGNYKKFNTSLKFEEKNNHIGSNRSGNLNIKKLFRDNYYMSFDGKKNLKDSSSEYLRYGINFENDCLITSLTFSRDFYTDKDITSSKTLIFGIVLKPFADNFAPDLSNFIN